MEVLLILFYAIFGATIGYIIKDLRTIRDKCVCQELKKIEDDRYLAFLKNVQTILGIENASVIYTLQHLQNIVNKQNNQQIDGEKYAHIMYSSDTFIKHE